MVRGYIWLVALSGGADSVALLLMLKEQGYTNLHALHCNFHLRGEESDRDQHFCEDLCQRQGIELHVKHFDTISQATLHHESIEMAARRLRYDWFRDMQISLNAEGIFVAHHQDDQAETVLMNLLRGTGKDGLCGMKPDSQQNGLRILRPLLGMSKAKILEYLEKHHQTFVTDSTNLERDALRNRIRLDVIPLLRQLNPQVSECIARTAENLRLEDNDQAEGQLFRQLSPLGFTRDQILDISSHLGKDYSGKTWQSHSHILILDRGKIQIKEKQESGQPVNLPQLQLCEISNSQKSTIPDLRNPMCAYVDADTVHGKLFVRKLKTGDRFKPYGMEHGTRLVSDYLTDRKISLFDKREQLVICDDDGIVWLFGHTIDHRHRIRETTKRIIRLTLQEA